MSDKFHATICVNSLVYRRLSFVPFLYGRFFHWQGEFYTECVLFKKKKQYLGRLKKAY